MNPHAIRHTPLKRACLPIPAPPQVYGRNTLPPAYSTILVSVTSIGPKKICQISCDFAFLLDENILQLFSDSANVVYYFYKTICKACAYVLGIIEVMECRVLNRFF